MIATAILLIGIYQKKYDIGTFTLLLGLITSATNQIDSLILSISKGTFGDVKYMLDYYDFVFLTDETNEKKAKCFDKLHYKILIHCYMVISANWKCGTFHIHILIHRKRL